MKQLRVLATAFVLLFTIQNTWSQSWASAQNTDANFYSIRQQFLDYWNGQKPERGTGHSVFRRWEWYWETRVMPDGSFPPSNTTALEWAKYRAQLPAQDLGSAANWTSLGPNSSNSGYNGIGRVNCIAVHPSSSNILWVGTPAGGLWKSTNGGSSWSTNTDNFTHLGVSAILIDPIDPNTMYLGTGDGFSSDTRSTGVLKSTDGGISWNTTGLSWNLTAAVYIRYMAMHPTNTGILLAAASNGLHRSADGGATWTRVVLDDFYDVKFKPGDPSVVYAAADNRLYKSTNAGATWATAQILPSSDRLAIAVTPADPNIVAAVVSSSVSVEFGAFKGLYLSTNSGSNYTLQSSSPNILGSAADGSSEKGQGWYDLCIAISPTDPKLIFVGGVNLWKSTDAGLSWSLVTHWRGSDAPPGTPVVHADKHVLLWNGATLFKGCDGGIYKTTNAGTSWTDLSSNLAISQMYRLGVSQSDNKVICGLQDNGTKLRTTAGSWTDNIGGDGMECFIHPTNANIMYGESQYGHIRRSTNGGSNWTNIHQNVPDEPDGAWVTPFVMDPNVPTTIYVGYKDVYKSTNQGSNWTAISSGLSQNNLRFIAVAPASSDIIYASDGNEVYRTVNGGNAWTTVTGNLPKNNPITYLTVDPGNPDNLFVTFGGYTPGQKVYTSTTGGTAWANLTGTLPNIPANCITVQPNSNGVLYLGMDVGIYRRDFGATEWVLFNTGLPNVPVTELEIRNSTGKIRASTYGRGLWESDLEPLGNTCLPPEGLSMTNPGSRTATLQWDKNTAATGYTLDVRVAGATAWTSIPNIPDTAGQFYYFAPCSNYEWRVQSVCSSAASSFSAKKTFSTTACSPYCPSYGQGKNPVLQPQPAEWIEQVRLGAIDNNSGKNWGYGDYTGLSTGLMQGETVDLTLMPGFSGTARPESWIAWIDFNRDNDFGDAGEQVFAQMGSDGAVNGAISVPFGAAAGATRLRISMKFGAVAEPCEAAFSEGEVEDYTVNILAAPPALTLAPAALDFPAAGASKTVTLDTNCDWALTGAPAWITVNPASGGPGTTTITIAAGKNGSIDQLAGLLTFSGCGGQVEQNLPVLQNAGAPALAVSPSDLVFPAAGASITLTLSTNCDWSLTDAPVWVSASPASGSAGTFSLTVTAGSQAGIDARSAILRFSGCSGQVQQDLSVLQNGAAPALSLTPGTLDFPASGNTQTLVLNTNCDWSASGAPAWLSIDPLTGNAGSTTITISADTNFNIDPIGATILFAGCGGQIEQALAISQIGTGPALIINPASLAFPDSGNTQTITLNTNCDWSVSGTPAWLSIDPASGTAGAATVTITAVANSSIDSLASILLFAGCAGEVEQNFPVTQSGATLQFNLNPTAFTVDHPANCVQLMVTANTAWTATAAAAWITSITPADGTGSDTLEVCYAANPDTTARQTTLLFVPVGGDSIPILITQLPLSVGVDQAGNSDGNDIRCIPNPVRQSALFFIRSERAQTVQLDLFAADGRLVYSFGKIAVPAGEQLIPWQAEGFPAGHYTFRCLFGQTVLTGQVVLIR